jgi:GNAT superfamily N-acetyltransferase
MNRFAAVHKPGNPSMKTNLLRHLWTRLRDNRAGPPVLVKELGERDRKRMLRHFLALNRRFQLVGVGHLAFLEKQGDRLNATAKDRVAEFGVSVSGSARGQGVGSALFERAAIHCRNSDIDTLYMQCLSSNATMMHIARKAGMQIKREYGEADAYLHLPPPSPGSVLQEAFQEQFASIDYAVKANARAAMKWLSPKK